MGGYFMNLTELWRLYEADKRIQGFSPLTIKAYTLQLKILVAERGDLDIVQGLRARGGYTVDLEWKDGSLTKAVIASTASGPCCIRSAISCSITVEGKPVESERPAGLFRFHADAGVVYTVLPD
jgi:hypothetical protein